MEESDIFCWRERRRVMSEDVFEAQ